MSAKAIQLGNPNASFVTHDECMNQHRTTKWSFTVLFALMTVMLTMVGFAAKSASNASEAIKQAETVSQTATTKATDVEHKFNVYKASDESTGKEVINRLDDIKKELGSLRDRQDKILDRLLDKSQK